MNDTCEYLASVDKERNSLVVVTRLLVSLSLLEVDNRIILEHPRST